MESRSDLLLSRRARHSGLCPHSQRCMSTWPRTFSWGLQARGCCDGPDSLRRVLNVAKYLDCAVNLNLKGLLHPCKSYNLNRRIKIL